MKAAGLLVKCLENENVEYLFGVPGKELARIDEWVKEAVDAAIERANAHLDASAVMVNDHSAFRVDWMPFAGLRQSGLGAGGVPHTFRDMQIEKLWVGPVH